MQEFVRSWPLRNSLRIPDPAVLLLLLAYVTEHV